MKRICMTCGRPAGLRYAAAVGATVLLLAAPAHAQETPQPLDTPKAQPAAQKPAAREEVGQGVNVRLDVTITDQSSAQPTAKAITMVVADNWQGRLRTEGNAWTTHGAYPVALNVDARPRIVADKILLMMTVEYKPSAPEPKPGASSTTLNQSFQVLLQDGKPLVVSQSADPNSDRKVKLEVKATVIR